MCFFLPGNVVKVEGKREGKRRNSGVYPDIPTALKYIPFLRQVEWKTFYKEFIIWGHKPRAFTCCMHIWASPACQTNCLGWRNLQCKLQKLNFTYGREARLQVSDKIQVVPKTRLVLFFYRLQLDTTIWYLQPTFAKRMQIGLLELAQYLKESADTKQLQLLQPWDSRNFWHFFSTLYFRIIKGDILST